MDMRREIDISETAFKQLYEIMKKRGFPKKPLSESEVIEEAISLLYSKEIATSLLSKKESKGGKK